MNSCRHNARSRFTDGFMCEDCNTFFSKDSPTYRSGELLSSIWMVLNNINVGRFRAGDEPIAEVAELKEEIGIGETHEDFEALIKRAEAMMAKYGKNSESASVTI